jgi:bifunctional DNA-binding transcriptional regulator/antitoxin component of YhaV-PrlF toxin-antitoxin module
LIVIITKDGDYIMKCTHRLVFCNEKFHVILPNNWVKAVGIKKGDHATLEIDDEDFTRLIIKKSDE